MLKSELRKLYLEKRRALTPTEHAELSAKIVGRVFAETDISAFGAVHSFISMKHTGEVETGDLFRRIWREYPNIRTFAPRVNEATDEIDSVVFEAATKLIESKWKIFEPADGQLCDPQNLDLVVVPLMCFDSSGIRVGYGRGFYDRFLARCRPDCLRAGLSFFPPVERIDDAHNADVPLDLCVTPDITYRW